MKVVVYVRAGEEKMLAEQGKDPAVWVRSLVRWALSKERERLGRVREAG